jgi:uncharacterized damage-inducible protein DinB
MNPADARILFDFLLPQLASEQSVTQRILAAVPAGQEAYKPNPKCMTAFELSRHIAICELWFLDAVISGEFDEPARPPDSATTCGDLAAWYAENTSLRIPLLLGRSGQDLTKPLDYIGLRNDPAVAYLNIAIRHTAHHRGQLSTYLRGMEAAVPAIYVESADEPYPLEDGSVPPQPPPAF